jgi:hypothetical protein
VLPNKNESRSRDSPPAAGRFSDIIPFRRSAFLPGGFFIYIGEFGELSYVNKKLSGALIFVCTGQPFLLLFTAAAYAAYDRPEYGLSYAGSLRQL